MKRWYVALLLLITGVAGCNGCKKSGGSSGGAAGPSFDAAKEMLSAFIKPGADAAALTAALRAKPEDYAAVFVGDSGKRVRAMLDPLWENGKLVLKPLPEQTEIQGAGVTGAQLAKGEGHSGACPGYKDVAEKINPAVTIYCARFVKPGEHERGGLHINGLVFVNGHWALFQNAPRALR